MASYYKTITVGKLELSNGKINQTDSNIQIALNNVNILDIKNNNAYLNNSRILTVADVNDINIIKISFGSGIYLASGKKYLRYCGNSDSGYDTTLRVANIYNSPFPLKITKLAIQKGFAGITKFNIPLLNYSKDISGNFYSEDIDVDIGLGSQLFIEIDGDPSLETIVDLYIEKSTNQIEVFNNLVSNPVIPNYNELFTYNNQLISSKYSIQIQ